VNLAAIDIGSNGARLYISRVIEEEPQPTLKQVEYVRFPLRLGKSVFETGKIDKEKQQEMLKLMHAFKLLMDLHQVEDYLALATSAMREASNGLDIAKKIEDRFGLQIQIIDGKQEAEYTGQVIGSLLDADKNYIHIDVGGGSTELNYYIDRQKVATQSYEIGSIRNAQSTSFQEKLKALESWIREQLQVNPSPTPLMAIGTGGNINKIASMLSKKGDILPIDEIRTIRNYVAAFDIPTRIHRLKLNPDRAETLPPAADIYISAMEAAQASQMLVPDVGLKNGIMQALLQKNLANKV
jgi:exopolyphosphatase/guanosine-5'-triphosphate,3'-diphosphate pyrophosphatase